MKSLASGGMQPAGKREKPGFFVRRHVQVKSLASRAIRLAGKREKPGFFVRRRAQVKILASGGTNEFTVI